MNQQVAMQLPAPTPGPLTHSDLEFHTATRLWMKADAPEFGYSDGTAVENGLLESLRRCRDVSMCSSELPPHIKDWPTLYHFSSSRANVLRPIAAKLSGARVLEIGAGCGAITRFLGETAEEVFAVEGSPRRALITRERTRDLDNVHVVAANMQDVHLEEASFDVVTLIGVLEYARLFVDGANPFQALLEHARRHLKPDGILVVAIENKLGLKYLSGAPEDHVGRPYIGVEDRYTDRTARTFGAVELKSLLSQSGFGNTQLMGSFPDYKVPFCIVSESGAKHPEFDPTPIIQRAVSRDPQYPKAKGFDHVKAWRSAASNHLSIDLANSFIAIAHAGADTFEFDLAYHYATERRAAHRKQVRFIDRGNAIVVKHERLYPSPSPIYQLPEETPYYRGSSIAEHFATLLEEPNLRVQHLIRFFDDYTQAVSKIVGTSGLTHAEKIDGQFLDLSCENLIRGHDNELHPIDLEWISETPIPLGRLIFRSVYWLLDKNIGPLQESLGTTTHQRDLAITILSGIFPSASQADIMTYCHEELAFFQRI